jgi:ribokinase
VNILCIGESTLEITSTINCDFSEGLDISLPERLENGAGYAGNVAYLLTKWGLSTYIASMLGSDDNGEKIKKEFESIGTKIDYVETSYDKQTGIKLVLVNSKTNKNTIIRIGNKLTLKKHAFVVEPNIIFLDGSDLESSTYALDKYPNAKSFLSVKENNHDTQELCRYVKYIVFSKEMAEAFSNTRMDFNDTGTIVNVYSKLKQKFPKAEIFITINDKGSIYSVNGQIKIMPPVKVNAVDTNGAGSAFIGGLIYGIGREFDIDKAISFATIAASLTTTKLTSRASIPSLIEVSNYYDSKFGTTNNVNPEPTPKEEVKQEVNMSVTESTPAPVVQETVNNDNQQNTQA